MADCIHCGKEAPKFHNYCCWECHIEAAKADGGRVIAPNGLPLCCIRSDGALLEHEHADHPFYKFPVQVRFHKTPQEMFDAGDSFWVDGKGRSTPKTLEDIVLDCFEDHALLYAGKTVALTVYECCYALFSLQDGRVLRGSLWTEGHWYLTPEALEKIRGLKHGKK